MIVIDLDRGRRRAPSDDDERSSCGLGARRDRTSGTTTSGPNCVRRAASLTSSSSMKLLGLASGRRTRWSGQVRCRDFESDIFYANNDDKKQLRSPLKSTGETLEREKGISSLVELRPLERHSPLGTFVLRPSPSRRHLLAGGRVTA